MPAAQQIIAQTFDKTGHALINAIH